MRHTHHHFLITFAILVTVLVVSLYLYMSHSTNAMLQEVASAKEEVMDLEVDSSMDTKLKKLYSGSEGDWEKLYSAFVPEDNVVPFIEALEALGPRTGGEVTVASIDSSSGEAGSLAVNGYVNAKVTVCGSWGEVIKILELVENVQYKVMISNVRVDLAGEKGKSDVEWVMSFDIRAVKSI